MAEVEVIVGRLTLGVIDEIDIISYRTLWSIFRIWNIILIQRKGMKVEGLHEQVCIFERSFSPQFSESIKGVQV